LNPHRPARANPLPLRRARGLHPARALSTLFSGLTALATYLILAILLLILGHLIWAGRSVFDWRFLTTGTDADMFDIQTAGILPMVVGTTARVMVMTLFVMPAGIITALYLGEFTHAHSRLARLIRGAVNNLAGVPSIVFGLFGLGFFVAFVGGSLDEVFGGPGVEPKWGKPCLLWASLTLAVMTLPVVIVATEESIRAIPSSLREASFALGATRLQTIRRVILPQAMPGILTGGILAIGRAAGEVAPILFTGAAYYMARLPHSPTDQFMDLGYHAFILATQSQSIESIQPILFATVLTLLLLTLALSIVAMFIRAQIPRAHDAPM